jgi:hypothetical protein
MQYENATQAEFDNSYKKSSWMALEPLSYPAIGNHEVQSGNDTAYCATFSQAHCVGAARWYAFDLDVNWRAIVLDSNQPSNATQLAWLDAELAAVGSRNVLVYWHHARWRNGGPGHNESQVTPLMQRVSAAHVDLVLWGHDHMYTRWGHLGPAGPVVSGGFRAFTVGTGGAGGPSSASDFPGTEKDLFEPGVLELTLRAHDYSWRFVTTRTDSSGRPVADDSGTDNVTL